MSILVCIPVCSLICSRWLCTYKRISTEVETVYNILVGIRRSCKWCNDDQLTTGHPGVAGTVGQGPRHRGYTKVAYWTHINEADTFSLHDRQSCLVIGCRCLVLVYNESFIAGLQVGTN